ncbi:hypothetical protein [Pseudobacteroides cellulosolvens]|uniref:S-layer domain-containing protein n=1 Tax=Pseudobacteroides cellulosolvens ATCC 35603 = DSM 2933 TaxID=398512 RepID=A0A0L6JW49_9FIRM|nr:hypothetical protein [Pseudobacteroides cellulosolvens]KNY29657.1 hypothetical protein Bccel_4931 [Pseudobacteroides cellulosolvens ATCC 35603 = DSM 2933]
MKNLKKMLSVIVVIAMLATTMIPAFAADTAAAPKTDAEIAQGLGVVIGGNGGITEDYLKASTQRYQSAIIFLRLLGLESTAKVFDGKDNFTDAKLLAADMQKYLGYLKANPQYGWIGSGNGKFDPTSATSAQAFYKVLLEGLGYKCTVGDVKGDFDYADTITFAASKGLTKVANVSKFTNADLITAVLEVLPLEKNGTGKTLLKTIVESGAIKEEVAKEFMPSALELPKTVTTAVYSVTATNGQLTVVMSEDVGATPADADFTVTQAINGAAATTVTGTVYGYTYATKTAVINVPVVAEASAEQSVVYSVKYKDTTAVTAPAVVVGASFGIKDVVEPSLKLIKVNLNKDYDSAKDTFTVYKTSDTAATVAQTVKAVTGNSKQVLVIATGTYEADVDYTVKMTRDGKDYTKAFKVAADSAVPQIVKAEAIGNKKIRVTFSEPVQNAAAFKDDGGADSTFSYNFKIGDAVIKGTEDPDVADMPADTASAKQLANKVGSTTDEDIVVSDDLTSVDFVLNNALATGEYTLSMLKNGADTNVKDYAGYEVPLTSAKFTVSLSLTAAAADKLTVNSRSEVAVDFTAAISAPSTSMVFWNTDGVDTNTAKTANAVAKTTDTKYTFSFTTNVIPTGKVYFFVKGIVDAYGNAVPTKKFEVTVGSDAIATTTITVENEQTVKVKFSKDMAATLTSGVETNSGTTGNAARKDHYTIKKADGTAVEITEAKYVAAVKTTTLTLKEKQSGACTISISGVKDVVGQEMQAVSSSAITFTDVTAPTVTSVTVKDDSNKIYVVFSEKMATTGTYSALNAANYKWMNTSDTSFGDLPSGTTIAVSSEDSKAIVITLPTDKKTKAGDTKVKFGYISGSTIKAVSDVAGNVLSIGNEQTSSAIVDGDTTIAGTGEEVKITSGNTLRVKVLGTKLNSVSYSDFEYKTDKVAYAVSSSAKLVDVDGTQYVELTTAADAFTSSTDITQVKVRTIASPTGTKTSVGTAIDGSVESVAASATSFTTSIKSVSILDNNEVIVILEGNIDDAASFASSVLLSQTIGTTTTNLPVTKGTLVGSATKSNVVKLETNGNIDETASVLLKTKPTADIVAKDVNKQYIVTDTTGKTGSKGFMAEKLEVAANTITITFNQVPKLPDSPTVTEPVANKITIADVGEITSLASADATANSVEVVGKTIVITLTAATADDGVTLFTPNANLKNTGSTGVNTDVKVLYVAP